MEILKRNGTNTIYYALAALLAVVYFMIVGINTFNVPENDDFLMLKFVNNWMTASSFKEKFDFLFAGNGDNGIGSHTVLPMKIILLLSYWIFGAINFSSLIYFSMFLLLGVVLMLIIFAARSNATSIIPIISLLVTTLILNGQNFETSVWAMVGLSNVGALLIVLLAIFFTLHKSKKYFIYGTLFSILTVFSNGNGLFVLPILAVSLLFQERKREALIFTIIVGLAVVGYIMLYYKTNESNSFLEKSNIMSIIAFFTFVGCGAYISASVSYIATAVGTIIVATYLYLLFTLKFKRNLFLFSFFSFMLITAVAVALNRNSEGMGDARFRIYGSMFLAIEAIFIIENFKRLKALDITVVFMALFFFAGSTLLCYQKVDKLSEHKKASTYLWKRINDGLVVSLGSDSQSYANMKIESLKNAEKLDIFKMPIIKIPASVPMPCSAGFSTDAINCGIDTVLYDNNNLAIRGWAYSETMSMPFTDIYLQLYNDTGCYEFSTMYQIRPDIIPDRNKKQCGFFVLISKNDIPSGDYFVGIKIRKRFLIPRPSSTQSIKTKMQIANF